MNFSKFLIFTSMVLALAACNTKRNPYFGDDEAQFYISSVEGKTEASGFGATQKNITQMKLILSACLKTLAGGPIPPGLTFGVEAGTEVKELKTNKDGCIAWTELHSGLDDNEGEINLKLVRTVIAKNEYNGKRSVNIYWNIKKQSFENNLEHNIPPKNTEVPAKDGFQIADVYNTKERETHTQSTSSSRLILPSITLNHLKLSEENPFSVDQNLTLYTHHTYQVQLNLKYLVNTIDNPENEVSPRAGQYKVTLVFMDDPQIDLEKITTELGNFQSMENLNKSQSSEGHKLQTAAQKLVSEKQLSPVGALTEESKKKLLVKSFTELVHTTSQFVVDKKPDQTIEKYVDLKLSKLANLDVRSVVAMTIENVSPDAKVHYKGHAIGYVKGLLDPGEITLMQTPIEADSIYDEVQKTVAQTEKVKPLERMFIESVREQKNQSLAPIDMSSITTQKMPPNKFANTYPFKQELENFLSGKQDNSSRGLFLKSLCYKLFVNDSMKGLEQERDFLGQLFDKRQSDDQDRLSWASRCYASTTPIAGPMLLAQKRYYTVKVLDFVTSTEGSRVQKLGSSVTEEISMSRGLEDAISDSFVYGSKLDGSAGIDLPISKLLPEGIQEFFPISLGGSVYFAAEHSRSNESSGKISRDSGEKLSVNIDTFRVSINARRCAVVRYEPWLVSELSTKYGVKVRDGFVACSDKAIHSVQNEKYYVVTQECSEKNGTTNCASDDETYFRAVLRGEPVYKEFVKLMTNTENLVLYKADPNALNQLKEEWHSLDSKLTSQPVPGALSPSIATENDPLVSMPFTVTF